MKIALSLLAWAAVLTGAWVIWMASQLFHVLPGVFGAEGLAVLFARWMTLEATQMWMAIISFHRWSRHQGIDRCAIRPS